MKKNKDKNNFFINPQKKIGTVVFLFIIFLSTYVIHEREKKKTLTLFFQEFLFLHGGAFTLFGSKPISIEALQYYSKKELEEQKQYLKNHPEIEVLYIDRNMEEGWLIWKKKEIVSNSFIFTEIDIDKKKILLLINKKETIKKLKEHYEDFRQILDLNFDPEKIITEKEAFWKKILQNHKAKGILLGYGYKNALLFDQKIKGQWKGKTTPSENSDPRISAEVYFNDIPFRIPVFSIFDEESSHLLIKKYKKERESILETYKNKDFLKLTIEKIKS